MKKESTIYTIYYFNSYLCIGINNLEEVNDVMVIVVIS